MDRVAGTINSPSASQDDALLARVRNGDEQAMAALYDRYAKVIYSVALRVLRDRGAAEDVMQEVLMQVWRSPDGFEATRGSLGGWLAVVARNRAIDALRRKRPVDAVDILTLPSGYDLANEAERNSLAEKAREIVRRLPLEQRKMLELAFFDGLTHTEIAGMTDEPLGTVKTRIRSALTTLRKALTA